MMKRRTLSRPATSAIAAFLAVTTPAAFAQEAPSVAMTPPVAVPPAAPPPAAEPAPVAPIAAPQPATTPQPVIRVPLDIAPEPAALETPAPRATGNQAARPPARAERPAPRVRTAAPAEAPAAAPLGPAAPLASEALPVTPPAAAPIEAPIEPAAEAAPTPVATAAVDGDAFPWEIAGSAAALLVFGGAGLAFARRRRGASADAVEGMSFEQMAAAEAVPYHAPPREEVVRPAPVAHDTPSFAAAPHGSMGRHEALAMAGPTPDNPFETLKKRLQRARFLDRQERAAYEEALAPQADLARKPVSAWEIAQRDIGPAPAEQEIRRPERGPARQGSFRPGFARN
ncbi:MAG: hypothetical protein C0520_08285 [Sphingopyxis sp.]|nr:hypothetical protein [Sphingopyxis sp.]